MLMNKLLLMVLSAVCMGNAYADNGGGEVFKYGRYTCEVQGGFEKPSVAITDYDCSYTTEPLIFPETINYNGTAYDVVTIATKNLLTGRYVPERVVIPNSVKTVGSYAFGTAGDNHTTTDIEFGENVEWISEYACYGYSKNVHIKAKYPPVVESVTAFMWEYSGTNYYHGYPNIFVPRESLGDYRTSEWWKAYRHCMYAAGSLNFIELDDFYLSDGIKTNSSQKARIQLVNDTGLEVKSFSCKCSDSNLLDVTLLNKADYEYWYTINLQSHDTMGTVTVTVIVEMNDGTVYEQDYEVEIYASTDSVDEVLAGMCKESGAVYSLDGRKIADSLSGLQKGIYLIKEGDKVKKVMVR